MTDEQIQQVTAAGFTVKAVSNISKVAVERSKEVSRVNRFAETRDLLEVGSTVSDY